MSGHSIRRRAVAWLVCGTFAATAVPCWLAAQERPTSRARQSSPVIRIAKWGLVTAAVGIGAYALRSSDDAADAYDALRDWCLDAPSRCDHRGGPYPDPVAEGFYREALRADRRARAAIFGGQAAFLGGVALFIYDLRGEAGPPTIPYPGRGRDARQFVVLRLEF